MRRPCRPSGAASARGVAAVEFALVMPAFLFVVGMIVIFGNAMWVRLNLHNFATSAAHACALELPVSDATFPACVASQWANFRSTTNITVCTVTGPQVTFGTPQQVPRAADPNHNQVHLGEIGLGCRFDYLPFGGVMAGGKAQPFSIQVKAAMPFIPTLPI